jgi:hypothetical protein
MFMFDSLYALLGPVLVVGISLMGVRMLSYWRSFAFASGRYRQREVIQTDALRELDVPFVKIQITTRGLLGSTEVIVRSLRNVMELAQEDPAYYGKVLSVEVMTESEVQARALEHAFSDAPVSVDALVLPAAYTTTPNGTQMKARALHYMVERRREGWNHKPGRTFIVHYDEESLMVPTELRKLLAVLATTDKKLLEGPIHYPLEYADASVLCRAMEASRPIGCFECRHVMEKGVPLHLHGSNLVVEEEFENVLGWDIGSLDGQPLIAEDYVFGMNAFLLGGSEIFGWHGCVMLEQPPFSVKSAFKQRHRWITGVLQGMAKGSKTVEFTQLPTRLRLSLVWGTRFRIATFALGAVLGVPSLLFLPLLLIRSVNALISGGQSMLPPVFMLWLAAVGAMWLGSVFIGAWYNVAQAGFTRSRRWNEIGRAIALAPIAGVIESSAGLQAVIQWGLGRRTVSWQPTPKTKAADAAMDWSQAA